MNRITYCKLHFPTENIICDGPFMLEYKKTSRDLKTKMDRLRMNHIYYTKIKGLTKSDKSKLF